VRGGKIIFAFKPMFTLKGTKYESLVSEFEKNKKHREGKDYSRTLNYKGFKIPTHMDLTEWPNISFSDDYKNAHATFTLNEKSEGDQKYIIDFIFHINEDNYNVTVRNREKILFTFSDKIINVNDLTSFIRTIHEDKVKKTYIYNFSNLVYYVEDKKVSFIDKISKDFNISEKIITLDLETRTIEGKMIPICMSIFDGKKATSFLLKNEN
jgi:hypothetical protein